jgi:hypothetical protein
MAGLHVHLRAVTLAAALVAAPFVGGSCSCSDRPIGEDPETHGEPACLWLISPYGYRADGSAQLLWDKPHRRMATVCLCITEEEFEGLGDRLERVGQLPEEGTLLEEFNELAYDECRRLADSFGDIVEDECLDYYENGTWLKDIYFSSGAWANATPPGFTCAE